MTGTGIPAHPRGPGTGFMPLEFGTIATATASGQRGWQLAVGKVIGWQVKALGLASAVGTGIHINCHTKADDKVVSL